MQVTCLSNIFLIDEIQRIPEKPVGPLEPSVKCLKFPDRMSPDLQFKTEEKYMLIWWVVYKKDEMR